MSLRGARLRVAAVVAVAALGSIACDGGGNGTGDGNGSDGGGGTELTLSAVDNEFDPTELAVTPGEEVTVAFTNNGQTLHTFTSEELGFDTGNVDPGGSTTVTFTAPEQATQFVCTLHRSSDNMVGQILPNM